MSRILLRRLLPACFAAITCYLAAPSSGLAQLDWNGTWIGNWETGHGIQIIFAGNELIGVYWEDDYVSEAAASLSAGGTVVTITWPSVRAILTRDGPEAAHIVIRETGRPDTAFPLKLDD